MINALSMTELKQVFTYPNHIELENDSWVFKPKNIMPDKQKLIKLVQAELIGHGWALADNSKSGNVTSWRMFMLCSIEQLKEEFSQADSIGEKNAQGLYPFEYTIPKSVKDSEQLNFNFRRELEELGWRLILKNQDHHKIQGFIQPLFMDLNITIEPEDSITELATLELLRDYIKTVDIINNDTPVGITLLASGRPCVKYSKASPIFFDTVSEALDHIATFLKGKGFTKG